MINLLLAIIYLAFISLGLPDAILGSAWPTMSHDIGAQISWAGGISMVIFAGTIVSALLSDRITKRFGAGKVTFVSVALTALALLGFSFAPNYLVLIFLAIPYGLGAGGVDAALNNYVALHYESRHMSWLHCMWGIGASAGPYVMGFALSCGFGWSAGYQYIAIVQVILTVILFASLPLWNNRKSHKLLKPIQISKEYSKTLSFSEVLRIPGAKNIFIMFFCYCAIEQTAGLWASSYMVLHGGVSRVVAAGWASLFYVGITAGRFISGFLTMRFNDETMIRLGQLVMILGVIVLLLPLPNHIALVAGFVIIGLGCAPIYPCIIHSTPHYFGADKSQAIVGVQMASAYIGSMLMPAIFGFIGQNVSMSLLPAYLIILLSAMAFMHMKLIRTCKSLV
ncbi:MFS transporter [Gardnerella pickettii]|uniref:Transporter, major facilitator family protein n=2 Tax=Gardnerella TaxID=2701 RepID=T2PLE5_9BIFI|nr:MULTISPECIES: MFS transporter [Gardnerella]MDK6472500.1 MFS transporter [Bifidobacterium sp. UMB9259]MDK7189363.1 MFS transporter [Bifidobacterium sp. UMB1230]MDK7785529.1 MFS transporter [Bifidobacterium sp. UMB6791B]MDK8249290.1 MFS transporter [Bifidobacterium sp. UMB6794B]MDK8636201.1 MFS transporter [Bifidobacterium sp. UMB6791A]PMC45585.1 MFS transporter [Peptoniphilus lacrimalis]